MHRNIQRAGAASSAVARKSFIDQFSDQRRDLLYASGYVASAFVALALVTVILTKPRPLKAK